MSGVDLRNPKAYCEHLLRIRTKEQKLLPLVFNEAQEHLYSVIRREAAAGKPIRISISSTIRPAPRRLPVSA